MKISKAAALPAAALTALALAGCGDKYVKRDEFNATVAELRNEDTRLRADIDALKADLQARFAQYDARITELQGRVRVDMTAHFDYDKADLRDADKPALDDFAQVIRERHPDVQVTVEGFTDPAGSPGYNKRLGQRRADAVRGYLVASGGLDAGKLRAVSYGEDGNRLIVPGAYGDRGVENRRVALVIDYVPRPAG